MAEHHYTVAITWTGNRGSGTSEYRAYDRSHIIEAAGKSQTILGSSDSAFSGNAALFNPEELFLSSISACHMLWYLHLCAEAEITVLAYTDRVHGKMQVDADGSGRFTTVTLRPEITIAAGSSIQMADALHTAANKKCFIANSCNFIIHHEPKITVL